MHNTFAPLTAVTCSPMVLLLAFAVRSTYKMPTQEPLVGLITINSNPLLFIQREQGSPPNLRSVAPKTVA